MAHGREGGPAWQGIVGDIEHAAHFQLAADEIHDHGAIGIGNPGPDAMQADGIKIRQVRPGAEFREGFIKQLGTRAGSGGELLGEAGLGRVEIRTIPLCGRGCGVEIGR